MPSLMAILGLDASSFQAKLTQSQKFAAQAGRTMGQSITGPIKQALGAFAVGMVVRDAFGMADRIDDLSASFQVSAETFQKWDIAARRAGMSGEDVGNALNKLKKARESAVGSGTLGPFAEFLIPMEALRDASISTEQILDRMIEVAGGADITDAQDVAGMELMGKSGARLLSVFQQLKDLGPVSILSDDEIKNMDRAVEGFEDLKRSAASLAGKGFIAATESPKSLWQAAKDLWRYGRGGTDKPVFGGPGSDPFGGFTRRTEGPASKLYGPVVESMSVTEVTDMKRTQLAIAEKIFQNSLKTMSTEEKRAQLNRQITEHMRASEKAFEDAEWQKAYQEQLKAEELRGELLGLTDAKAGAQGRSSQAEVNALQRIGAYAGGVSGTDRAIQSIDQNVRRIAERPRATGDLGGF